MTEYPHVPAAFINAIAEEGTKAEAVAYLQKQWNENCALRAQLKRAEENPMTKDAPPPVPQWAQPVPTQPSAALSEAVAWLIERKDGYVEITRHKEAADGWASVAKITPLGPLATPPAFPARDEVIELLASKFPITFTTFGNGKTPNALAANVADVVLAALSRSSTVTAPVIGGTAWCGHGVMASICPQCAAVLDRLRRDFEDVAQQVFAQADPSKHYNRHEMQSLIRRALSRPSGGQ